MNHRGMRGGFTGGGLRGGRGRGSIGGGLGLVLSTQPMAGEAGYATAVVKAAPAFDLSYTQTQGPSGIQAWVQGATGALTNVSGSPGGGGSLTIGWATLPAKVYLVPIDATAAANPYAPVETLEIGSQPGIYVSPTTPQATIDALKAANPGLGVYGTSSQSTPPPAATPWYDQPESIFGQTFPLWGLLAAGVAAIVVGPKLIRG